VYIFYAYVQKTIFGRRYWNDEEQTKSAIKKSPGSDETLWMHTGDEAMMDGDGYFSSTFSVFSLFHHFQTPAFPRLYLSRRQDQGSDELQIGCPFLNISSQNARTSSSAEEKTCSPCRSRTFCSRTLQLLRPRRSQSQMRSTVKLSAHGSF
jgi:hypothetical protein